MMMVHISNHFVDSQSRLPNISAPSTGETSEDMLHGEIKEAYSFICTAVSEITPPSLSSPVFLPVIGEVHNPPENGNLPVTKEEIEVHVLKVVDEAQDDTEPVVGTPTIFDDAPETSYAPIVMHLKVTTATISLLSAAIFLSFIEGKGVKDGVRGLIKGGALPQFFIIDAGWKSVGMDPTESEAKLAETADFANRLIGLKENYSTYGFVKGEIGQLFVAEMALP